MHPYGDIDVRADMPARAVEHHQHLLARPCADRLGELGQGEREGSHRDGRQQQPPGPTGVWMDKGVR